MSSKKVKIFGVYLFVFLFLLNFIFLSFTYSVRGEYGIKLGDSFDYNIVTLRATNTEKINLTLGELTIFEEAILKITVSYFQLPHIKFTVSANGGPEQEFVIFSDIIFVDRNWTALRNEFENTGYVVYENNNIFRISDNRAGIVEVEYWKKDGVLSKFYADNYSPLITGLDVGEAQIERIDIVSTTNIPFSMAIVGALLLGIALVAYKKFRIK